MILFEENTREEQILCVAKAMMTAIRTAPKAKGVDNIETGVISGITVRRLAARMRDIGKEQGLSFF
ncbi:MAG: ferredoxin, partial [Rikenellaceae bacterium]